MLLFDDVFVVVVVDLRTFVEMEAMEAFESTKVIIVYALRCMDSDKILISSVFATCWFYISVSVLSYGIGTFPVY